MTPPFIPGLSAQEQTLLYEKLNTYNQERASYKEAGAYLVVLPREGHPAYTLWIYSPLPGRFIFVNFRRMSTRHCVRPVRCVSTPNAVC